MYNSVLQAPLYQCVAVCYSVTDFSSVLQAPLYQCVGKKRCSICSICSQPSTPATSQSSTREPQDLKAVWVRWRAEWKRPKRSLCAVANKSNAAGLGGQIKQAPICFSSPKQILGKASYHHLIILVRLLSSYVKWKVIFCKYYIWWGIPRPLIWWSDKLINWYAAYIVVVSLILPRITWPHITWLYYFLSYVRIPRPLICWDKLILWWHWGGLPHLARAELAPPNIPSKFQPRW